MEIWRQDNPKAFESTTSELLSAKTDVHHAQTLIIEAQESLGEEQKRVRELRIICEDLKFEVRKKEDQLKASLTERSKNRTECQFLSHTLHDAVAHSTACTHALNNLFCKFHLSTSVRVWSSYATMRRRIRVKTERIVQRRRRLESRIPFETLQEHSVQQCRNRDKSGQILRRWMNRAIFQAFATESNVP